MLYTAPELLPLEHDVLGQIGEIRKNLKYALGIPAKWYGSLRRSTFARAIRGSNSIEGFHVSAEDALAAVAGVEPTDAKAETWHAIKGYRDAMTYILQLAHDPHFSYDESLFRGLHFIMLSYDLAKNPGRWRPGPISVIDEAKRERVYEGPDAEIIPGLVKELTSWLQSGNNHVPAMVRAAMAHLNLTMIHPFSDGNGRMARCLQTLVLAREGILEPEFCSIEEYLGRNTPTYYQVLADVGQGSWHPENDARQWIRFSLTAHYRQATSLLRRSKETARVWDQLETEVKRRGLPERMILALADAAFGYRVKNATYRSAAEVSENVASRDLKDLTVQGLLIPSGEKRGRYYEATQFVKLIRQNSREPKSTIDPFSIETLPLPGI
ncbi:MAG: Fic family protein [Nitrospirota bacterium]|nr:Fic family protein [Nitrospirota bacterium]